MNNTMRFFVTAACVVLSALYVIAQLKPPEASLEFVENGFQATCRIDGGTLNVTANRQSPTSALTRIKDPSDSVLAEVNQIGDILEIKLGSSSFGMSIVERNYVHFSAENRTKLAAFLESSTATLLRKCLHGLSQKLQNTRDNRGRRIVPFGLMLISMLLGGDDSVLQANNVEGRSPLFRNALFVAERIP